MLTMKSISTAILTNLGIRVLVLACHQIDDHRKILIRFFHSPNTDQIVGANIQAEMTTGMLYRSADGNSTSN